LNKLNVAKSFQKGDAAYDMEASDYEGIFGPSSDLSD